MHRAAVSEHQVALADRLEEVFRERIRYVRSYEADAGNGPSILFELGSRHPDLTVSIRLYIESVHLFANDAEVRILVGGPNGYDEYADDTVELIREFVRHPIRTRVLRPFFKWFPAEGAIYMWSRGEGFWNGGMGGIGRREERVFEDWWDPVAED